jgi:hypothetical protein
MKGMRFLLYSSLLILSGATWVEYERSRKQILSEYRSIPGSFDGFTIDQQGNLILAARDGNISKWTRDSVLLRTMSYQNFGREPMLDASNGLEVFAYYPLNRQLIVLDNQLNLRKQIDFNYLQNYQVQGFGRAVDGNCWILDSRDGFLRKIDFKGRVMMETLLHGSYASLGTVRICDNGEDIVIGSDSDKALKVLSATLNRIGLIPKPTGAWNVSGDRVYYIADSSHIIGIPYRRPAKNDTLEVQGQFLRNARVWGNTIVNLRNGGLHLYR